MVPKLTVVVQVDLEAHRVCVEVSGELTELNQQALHPLVHRARSLPPTAGVTVDLSGAHVADAAAVERLRQAFAQDPVATPVEVHASHNSAPHPRSCRRRRHLGADARPRSSRR